MADFSKEIIQKVWKKRFGNAQEGKDVFGRKIAFSEYGKKAEKGWEIDHVWPTKPKNNKLDGSNSLKNLQPLHRYHNHEKKDKLHGQVNGKNFSIKKDGKDDDDKIIGKLIINK